MDFNVIYEAIAPYLGAGTIAAGIAAVIGFCCKVGQMLKGIKENFTATNGKALDAFKSAIPKELYVNVQSLAKSELNSLFAEIKEKYLGELLKNTELLKLVAQSLASLKTVPDDLKTRINGFIDEQVKTTESIKVELLPEIKIEMAEQKNVIIE